MPSDEAPIDPAREIIDPHMHMWEILPAAGALQEPQRFLFDEYLALRAASGHNVTHTVYLECHQMHRADGPEELRCVGETEFANGIAAMSATGLYGSCRVAHRIVGTADLRLGSAVRPVLEAHVARAGERFRGIRMATAYSDAGLFGQPPLPAMKGVMRDPAFVAGAAVLAEMDLTLDVWCLHAQLGELAAVADALPGLGIVLNHVGTPESLGVWAGRQDEAFADWASRIRELAQRPNVEIKLGGLGMDIAHGVGLATGTATSGELAAMWRPCIETCIEAFSPQRAMFESNFPPDRAAGSYGATWNAFKRIAAGCSEAEKDALFRRNAARFYRIALPD